jgi:hypothetical protein
MKNILGVLAVAGAALIGAIAATFLAALAISPYALMLLACFAILKYLGWL